MLSKTFFPKSLLVLPRPPAISERAFSVSFPRGLLDLQRSRRISRTPLSAQALALLPLHVAFLCDELRAAPQPGPGPPSPGVQEELGK